MQVREREGGEAQPSAGVIDSQTWRQSQYISLSRLKTTEASGISSYAVVENGPDPAIHGVVRWRRCDLAAWLSEQFGVSLGVTTVGQELRRMGYAKLSARPRHHARDEAALAAFKKSSPTA